MCGIAGILEFSKKPHQADLLGAMVKGIAHRGRDGHRMIHGMNSSFSGKKEPLLKGPISLGHQRLAIIGLSEDGLQPMADPSGRLWLVFNGEIYNYKQLKAQLIDLGHRFVTATDTEVLIHGYLEWGIDVISKLNGMFAFALWDDLEQVLYCARDSIGIKPFYYYMDRDVFAFASESKALSSFHHGCLDERGVSAYYLGMYLPGSWSVYKGVQKLPAGSILKVSKNGQSSLQCFWSADDAFASMPPATDEELLEQLRASVQAQLVADVPVGVFLSGGVDSSAVAIFAAMKQPGIQSFSLSFETKGYDELPYAKQVAERYGTQHTEYRLHPKDLMGSLQASLRAISEPLGDSALVANFVLSKVAAEKGVKVILNGTGGDEVFGGYTRYTDYGWHRYLINHTPESLKSLAQKLLSSLRPDIPKRLNCESLDMFLCTGGLPELAQELFFTSRDFAHFLEQLIGEAFPQTHPKACSSYQKMLFDLKVYVPDQLLFLLDQTSMASTLEGRVPLLDVDLITKAYSLPFASHVAKGELKATFKRILSPFMDEGFFYRQKQGFGGPVLSWVKENYSVFMDTIRGGHPRDPLAGKRGYFEEKRFDKESLNSKSAGEIFRHYCFLVQQNQ